MKTAPEKFSTLVDLGHVTPAVREPGDLRMPSLLRRVPTKLVYEAPSPGDSRRLRYVVPEGKDAARVSSPEPSKRR